MRTFQIVLFNFICRLCQNFQTWNQFQRHNGEYLHFLFINEHNNLTEDSENINKISYKLNFNGLKVKKSFDGKEDINTSNHIIFKKRSFNNLQLLLIIIHELICYLNFRLILRNKQKRRTGRVLGCLFVVFIKNSTNQYRLVVK